VSAAQGSAPSFAGSIPELYDKYMVPLVFEPYAIDLAQRLARLPLTNLLELAAGTGVVTRRLAMALPDNVFIIATDLSQAMLDHAASVGTHRPVDWRQADAMQLPFDKASFDVVVCQFGVMFFPDKARAFAEVRRVLRSGGLFIFNAWDRIEENEFALVATEALARMFPDDPPRFMKRVPHGYHDIATIRRDLSDGGFSEQPGIQTVAARSRAASARIPAMAYCQGTPLRGEIEARDPSRLGAATDAVEAALAACFGSSAVDGKMQAHVIRVAA
jgi:ubiquinone/menaquinone biosynthesis C-methylase UbiE